MYVLYTSFEKKCPYLLCDLLHDVGSIVVVCLTFCCSFQTILDQFLPEFDVPKFSVQHNLLLPLTFVTVHL